MKYILLTLLSLIWGWSVFAFDAPSTYSPTAADQALVMWLEPQIDALYAADPARVMKITQKLKSLSAIFASNTREYYVLWGLYTYMIEISTPSEDDDLLNTLNALFGDKPTAAVVSAPAPTVTHSPTPVSSPASAYIPYSEAALRDALAQSKRVIINFRASWCPNCTAASNNIMNNLDLLPSDVVILEADYDTETALKAKYGVSRQTTFVHLDETGDDGKLVQNIRGIDDLLLDL